jgi:hypothetical protein
VNQQHEVLEPRLSRAEWALSITCVALTALTLVTFVVAGRGGSDEPATRQEAKRERTTRQVAAPADVLGDIVTPTTAPPRAIGGPQVSRGRGPAPLADLLVDVVPEGYVEVPSPDGPNGPFDLEGFVGFSDHPDEDRAVLAANGFRQGFVRSWQKSGPGGTSRLVASVFEFNDARGASALAEHQNRRSLREDDGVAMPIAGGTGVQFVHQGVTQTVHGFSVTFVRDGLLFYLAGLYPKPETPGEVLLTAQRQLGRLDRQGPPS